MFHTLQTGETNIVKTRVDIIFRFKYVLKYIFYVRDFTIFFFSSSNIFTQMSYEIFPEMLFS